MGRTVPAGAAALRLSQPQQGRNLRARRCQSWEWSQRCTADGTGLHWAALGCTGLHWEASGGLGGEFNEGGGWGHRRRGGGSESCVGRASAEPHLWVALGALGGVGWGRCWVPSAQTWGGLGPGGGEGPPSTLTPTAPQLPPHCPPSQDSPPRMRPPGSAAPQPQSPPCAPLSMLGWGVEEGVQPLLSSAPPAKGGGLFLAPFLRK